jgi:hypothetical protein
MLGGVAQANGTYGSTASSAINPNDTYFTGTGTVTVGPVATTTTVASNFTPATVGAAVTFTSTVAGSTPTGNVSFYSGATLLGTNALNGSSQASITTSSLAAGTYSITATYSGNANNTISTSTALSQVVVLPGYESWASDGAQGLTAGVNNDPSDDPDYDGFSNLMEFALGGAPMASSQTIQPTLTNSAGDWVFEYDRSDAAQSSTTQTVEYGNNLTGWTPVNIPATSAGIVEITPGSPSDHVKVTIPTNGTQTFIRLKVAKQ